MGCINRGDSMGFFVAKLNDDPTFTNAWRDLGVAFHLIIECA
jgi:hypothetical protein